MTHTYTQTTDPTDFWTWKKIEAGHYVLTTDTRYTATVRNMGYVPGSRHRRGGRRSRHLRAHWNWDVAVTSPSGKVWEYHGTSMAEARHRALIGIKKLMEKDEAPITRDPHIAAQCSCRRLGEAYLNRRRDPA